MNTPLLTVEVGAAHIDLLIADITTLDVDAIVNAANERCCRAAACAARSFALPVPI